MKKRFAIFAAIGAGLTGLGYYFSERVIHNRSQGRDCDKRKVMYQGLVEAFGGKRLELESDYSYTLIGHAFIQDVDCKKFMIISHGVTSSKEYSLDYIALFLKMGYNVIAMDSRYHGESGGKDISYGYYERYDLKKTVDYIRETYGDDTTIGIHGVSMGAGITLMYAGSVEDGADFYIVDCPYSDFYEEAKYRIRYDFKYAPKYTKKLIVEIGNLVIRVRSGFSLKDVRPINHVHKIKSPVMFINTREDKYIPPHMSQDLYERKEGIKYIYWVDTGGHSKAYGEDPETYEAEVEKFIDRYCQ